VYRVTLPEPATHRFHLSLQIRQPAPCQRLSLPVWIPGSYLVREFARHLQGLTARQGQQMLPLRQRDKCTWEVDCDPTRPLTLDYEVHAFDHSVRTAWLDTTRGFFNGTSLCLRVHGQESSPHTLTLAPSRAVAGWSVATGLEPVEVDARGFGRYTAADYDELVDCPVEMGAFWRGEFRAGGVPHTFVVAGAPPTFDGDRLLADTRAICEAAIAFWHGKGRPPHRRYVFMLNAVHDGYGGLEHRNSTALICNRADLPRRGEPPAGEGYTTLQGLISHEYFHTWNVKRLRPAEFARYDYTQENYTRLLWFFEGFTSYYDDLLLRRAGLIDDAAYLKLLNKTINQVLQTPGRRVQSVAQASFDAWTRYYRPDENTPNATVSYYTKGALVALCLDLTLRAEGRTTLDAVMRDLWRRCKAGPMAESDLLAVLDRLGGRSFAADIDAWVHGTDDLPVRALLNRHGVAVKDEPAALAQHLGLRVTESDGIRVQAVLHGGAAHAAGFAAGDEWLAVASGPRDADGWRLKKLDELPLYSGSDTVTALVARDRRLLRLQLRLPANVTTWKLAVEQPGTLRAWLDGASGASRGGDGPES
jgi:predicted metalloprotease with PDZ domain